MWILNRFLVWIGFNRRNGWLKNLFTYDFDTHVLVQASVNELDLSFVPLQSGLILAPAIIGLDKFYRINCSLPVSTVKQIQFNLWSVIEEKRQLCRRSPPLPSSFRFPTDQLQSRRVECPSAPLAISVRWPLRTVFVRTRCFILCWTVFHFIANSVPVEQSFLRAQFRTLTCLL